MGEPQVVVVGAGPAGLAVGACLKERGVPCVLLEQADSVGSSWRQHYERLALHTHRAVSSLPRLRLPDGTPTYASRIQFIDYLEGYARHFGLEPRFGVKVSAVAPTAAGWSVSWPGGGLQARAVVMASGYCRVPLIPQWPGREEFTGDVVHSSRYVNGKPFAGKRVLVVGAGNSGSELALDLLEHGAKVTMCIRSPINVVPRDVLGISFTLIGAYTAFLPMAMKDATMRLVSWAWFGNLERWGIRHSTRGPASQITLDGNIPIIDIGTIAAIKRGDVAVVPGIERFQAGGVRCVDGQEVACDAVVLATGFTTGLAELLAATPEVLDEKGHPRTLGAEAPRPGLYFVGFRNPITGFLNEVASDAEAVAGAVAAQGQA